MTATSPAIDWDIATDELVATLRDLIRIPSINPPVPDRPDGELEAARYLAGVLLSAGLEPEVIEPVPGRGSVHASSMEFSPACTNEGRAILRFFERSPSMTYSNERSRRPCTRGSWTSGARAHSRSAWPPPRK